MFTIRTGKLACIAWLALLGAGCSREQQDWRGAEAADSAEAYDQFIQHHPDSELVTEARTRIAQIGEERDWREAGTVDTADAYRQFLTQHPNGKWAQEAHIRIESFALDGSTPTRATTGGVSTPASASSSGSGGAARGDPSRAAVPLGQPRVGVQLGAFNTEAGARKEWQALESRFGSQLKGLGPHIVTADTRSGRLYRLQAMLRDEGQAHALCEALKQHGQGCMPVLLR
ncbi:MAG TPA: SPOR domain-containing protein [Steroidobacteraceae bacterium]|jgi:hypothetical protein